MIHTLSQLKALVRNKSGGSSTKAQVIIRGYVIERFLERLSMSPYKERLILKGGVLVSSIVGMESRTTMDIDATIKGLPLTLDDAKDIVNSISSIPLDDGMTFSIKSATTIIDESDYPGIRVMLDATLEKMHTPLKIDFSTDDVITPREISYEYRLMFEDRSISLLAYNLETVLAEKLETILTRGVANTRMRDFYDVYILELYKVDGAVLHEAFANTVAKRESADVIGDATRILTEIETDANIAELWESYQQKYDFAADLSWADAVGAVRRLYSRIAS